MLSSTKKTLAICVMFGLTMGLLLFVSQLDADVCTFFSSPEKCYAAVGGVSAGLSFVAWPFLNSHVKTYLSLFSTLPISDVFNAQMTILLYTETLKPIKNMYSVVDVTLDSTKCYYEENSPESFADILLSLDEFMKLKSLLEKVDELPISIINYPASKLAYDLAFDMASSIIYDSDARNKSYIDFWSSAKETIQKVGNLMDYAYYYDLIQQAMKYIGIFTLIIYPIWYCKYKSGEKRRNLRFAKNTSSWRKAAMLINEYLLDFEVIAIILCGDYFYRKQHADIYDSFISEHKSYQGDSPFQAELSRRLVACARLASPINYGYEVFLLAFVLRIVYIYGTWNLVRLPASICAHFEQKAKKDIAQKMVPWMERLLLTADD